MGLFDNGDHFGSPYSATSNEIPDPLQVSQSLSALLGLDYFQVLQLPEYCGSFYPITLSLYRVWLQSG